MNGGFKTKKELVAEILHCAKSPSYWLKTYCKIQHPTKGLIKFDTYGYQDDLLDAFDKHRFNIVLKSRQVGISTIIAGLIAHTIYFKQDKNVLVVATKQKVAMNLIRMIKIIFKNLPPWLTLSKILIDNKQSIELNNGSRVQATTTASDAGRSEALSLLVVDEAAHVKSMENLWVGLWPTLSRGGRAILSSCVTRDTFILTDKGIQTVDDFIINEKSGFYEIENYKILGKEKLRNSNLFYNNGIKNIKIIKTTYSELKCTENHKLWACKNGIFDWYEAGSLNKGDHVSFQYGMNYWGKNDDVSDFKASASLKIKRHFDPKIITPDLAYLIGLYISKGSFYNKKNKNGIVISSMLTIVCGDEVEKEIKKTFDSFYIKRNPEGKNCNRYCISSNDFGQFMNYLGFNVGLKAKEKLIPKRLFSMSEHNISALLQGIFDGDGTAHSTKGRVSLCSTSLLLIKQIQNILLNYGILSSIYKHITPPTQLVKVFSTSYSLELTQYGSKLFYQKIGFRIERKQKNNVLLENIKNELSNPNDIIPDSVNLFKQLCEYKNKTHKELSQAGINSHKVLYGYTKNVSKGSFIKTVDAIKENIPYEFMEKLNKIIHKNLKWIEIKDVQESQEETFDFSLPENSDDFWAHSVIYNGFLGHQTPNGTGNLFHKLYQQAQNNENTFNCRFGTYINPSKPEEMFNDRLMWWVHPENSKEWFQNETMGKSRREIAQEYECSFVASGDTFIFSEDIQRLEKQIREPIERTNFDRNLWIWKYPQRGATYLISVDISRGDSRDFSGFHIIRIDDVKLDVVGEYKGKITPDILGDVLVEASKKYNNAIIAVENNGGWAGQTILKIRQANYPFIYYASRNKREFIDPYYAQFADQTTLNGIAQPGYSITPLNRIPMLAKMEQYVRMEQIQVYSSRLLDEFRTFSWNNSRPEAQKGYHDDLVMSLCGGIWVREESFMNVSRGGNNLNQMLLDGISVQQTTTKQIPQFNFNQSGIYDRSRIAEFVQEQNRIIMGDGSVESMEWLFDKKMPVFKG